MTAFTTVQLIAQTNLRHIIRAAALKKWDIANTAYLVLQVSLIDQKIVTNTMLRATYGYMWGAYIHSVKDKPVYKMIDKVKQLTEKDIKGQIADFFAFEGKAMVSPMAQLQKAPLEDKRIYLRAVPVISAPVVAAYLGVATAAVNKFTADHYQVIGNRYARGYCLSMNEVFLIEQNPQWLAGEVSQKDGSEVKAVDDDTFDYLLYVG